MLPQSRSYDELYGQFRWHVPARFNIGVEVCDRWAERDPGRLALVAVSQDGRSHDVSYGWLRETSNRLANVLAAHGVKRGDRVAILLPQGPDVAAIHVAIYKLGAIALPLAILFGTDALAYRLQNAGAKALLTNAQGIAKIAEIKRTQRGRARRSRCGPVGGRTGRRRARHAGRAVARCGGFHAGRYRGRRSGDDDLHLRHHRAAQGRAARAPRAARPHAGDRAAAGVLPASRRPVLDPGGLGLGRGAARLPAAEPLLRGAGGGEALRQVRPRGGVRGDGAPRRPQRLHPADRAPHAARGAEPARPP